MYLDMRKRCTSAIRLKGSERTFTRKRTCMRCPRRRLAESSCAATRMDSTAIDLGEALDLDEVTNQLCWPRPLQVPHSSSSDQEDRKERERPGSDLHLEPTTQCIIDIVNLAISSHSFGAFSKVDSDRKSISCIIHDTTWTSTRSGNYLRGKM